MIFVIRRDDGVGRMRQFVRDPIAHATGFGEEIGDTEVMKGDYVLLPLTSTPTRNERESPRAGEQARDEIDGWMHSERGRLELEVDDAGFKFANRLRDDTEG